MKKAIGSEAGPSRELSSLHFALGMLWAVGQSYPHFAFDRNDPRVDQAAAAVYEWLDEWGEEYGVHPDFAIFPDRFYGDSSEWYWAITEGIVSRALESFDYREVNLDPDFVAWEGYTDTFPGGALVYEELARVFVTIYTRQVGTTSAAPS